MPRHRIRRSRCRARDRSDVPLERLRPQRASVVLKKTDQSSIAHDQVRGIFHADEDTSPDVRIQSGTRWLGDVRRVVQEVIETPSPRMNIAPYTRGTTGLMQKTASDGAFTLDHYEILGATLGLNRSSSRERGVRGLEC